MAHLDAIAAANRTMRVRSSNPVDDSGLRATVDEVGYKLEGSLEVPTFSTESGYAIPAVGSARRVELAKNASISSAFNSIIASNRRGNAIRALSRITGIKENELRARLSSHDLETYRNAMSNDRLAELYARISDGSVSPASLGFVIPDDADLQTAARISNNFGRMTSSDGIGPTAAMSVRDNYSSMNLQDLIREFNEAVDELFGFGRDGRYDSAEFKVKADSVKNRISNISSEIRRRYFESDEGKAAIAQIISDGPTASMSSEQPDLPIISGSAWLDTRLFEIYGEDKYETVARRIGARFDDLPSRNWNDPSDDDLVDIYHYAMMLGHDEMVEVAVRTGDFTSDAFEPTRASDFDARGATGIFARLSGITGLSPSAVEEYVDRGRNTATIRRLAAMDPYARVEEMNMMRRRNAFRRLLDDKKKELGEGFSDWLAQATMRNEDMLTDLNGRPMSSSMIESMGGPYIGFFGETPSEAMKRMAEYYGEEAPDEPTAAMSRRNFIPPRYDIKPHDGGWVIIDTANRNAISSRVFRDRLQALRGAKKMDRGDRSFNPFASDDPTAGMSSALPSTLRIPNDEARRFGAMVTRDQVSAAVSNYRNGRASLPYPSANYASPQQLMEGWVASDASLDTVMGRLEYLAKRGQTNPSGAENKAREIESLVNHLYKLQRRRNYFYNQLRDRLSSENPEMANILESWNSTRSGKNRESASNGERGLPFYNLPGGLSTYGYDENRPPSSYDRPERWAADADSRRFESFVSDFANAQINGAAGGRNASDIDQRNLNSIGKTVNDRVNVAVEDYIQNAQTRPIVKQAAKILDMANELKSESRNVDFLVDSGALEMMKMGGPRASAAFLVNAVSLGLVSSDRAKEMLDSAKADGMGKNAENYNLNRLEGARFKTNLSRIVSRLPIGRQRSRRN
jgi:hypothetical protein